MSAAVGSGVRQRIAAKCPNVRLVPFPDPAPSTINPSGSSPWRARIADHALSNAGTDDLIAPPLDCVDVNSRAAHRAT
jgi:hypothetical protein